MTRTHVQLNKATGTDGDRMDAEAIGLVKRQTVQVGGVNASEIAGVTIDGSLMMTDAGTPGAAARSATVALLDGSWQLVLGTPVSPRAKFKIVNDSTVPLHLAYGETAPGAGEVGSDVIPAREADGLCYHLLDDVKCHQGKVWGRWTVATAGTAMATVWTRS